MLRKFGLILFSLSMLSTGIAQAFSLSPATKSISISRKQVLYGIAAFELSIATYLAVGCHRRYKNSDYWLKKVNIYPRDFIYLQKSTEAYKDAASFGAGAVFFGVLGSAVLYEAYTS